MKLGALVCLLMLTVGNGHRAVAQAPAAPASEPQPFGDAWFEGTVGNATVRVYVGDAGWPKREGLWGIYYYTRHWTPLSLEGNWVARGRLRLVEGDPTSDALKPSFDLSVTPSGATGTWTSADGKRRVRVTWRRIPKPAPFDIAIRQARRFADPRWPLTLTYPAGWRLEVTDSDLTLRSPDPFDMLFENELRCSVGSGIPNAPGPNEPPVEVQWPFFRGPSGWLVDRGQSGACQSDCEAVKGQEVRGATILREGTGYRSHGPWGYMGVADTRSHLIIADGRWAGCFDRLLDADSRLGVR